MPATKHGCESGLFVSAECGSSCGHLVRASDVKIDYVALVLIHLIDASFLFFPGLFLKFELVYLLIFLANEFDLVLHEFNPLLFECIALLSDEVLEVNHEFFYELVGTRALSRQKILVNTVL